MEIKPSMLFFLELQAKFPQITFDYFQSNIEGELIDRLQQVGFSSDGIILNAAAYTHTSVGIGDAIKAIDTPVIEVHISNTFAREDFRHTVLYHAQRKRTDPWFWNGFVSFSSSKFFIA